MKFNYVVRMRLAICGFMLLSSVLGYVADSRHKQARKESGFQRPRIVGGKKPSTFLEESGFQQPRIVGGKKPSHLPPWGHGCTLTAVADGGEIGVLGCHEAA
ncbi:hypothetical protein AAVH_00596 [Aphelenchoides avenae]|nr:hypothetical protein AAVH_00596 [Aphelenchus avenae]